jgi:hypothetical protein
MCDALNNVTNPYYSINSVKNFFGGTDPIRIVIIIYIFLSFILNTIIFITIGFTIKLRKIKFPMATWIMLSVLLMNFFHTFAYFFQWVIKDDSIQMFEVDINGRKINVGALLTGNPKNIFGCTFQGYLLISTSISQDFLINIFFSLVNATNINEQRTKILLLVLGIIFPFLFTLFLGIFEGIGINDEFCYVKKFEYSEKGECLVYKYYDNFQYVVMAVYAIRVLNFIVTAFFLKRIWTFVRQKNKPTIYLMKSIFIPIIQLVTVFIGVAYRLINAFDPEISQKLSGVYLILNTVDGVLFPIGFAFQNSLIMQIKKLIQGKNGNQNKEDGQTLEFLPSKDDDGLDTTD